MNTPPIARFTAQFLHLSPRTTAPAVRQVARTRVVTDAVLGSVIVRALSLAACLWIFKLSAPGLGHVGGATSDTAIPQLMANADRLTPLHLFYWGQDRLGGWPFIFAYGVRALTGVGWTTDGLFWLLAAALLCTLWPLSRLGGRWGWALAAALPLAIVNGGGRDSLLDMSQPYAYQVTLLVISCWLLVDLNERYPVVLNWKALARDQQWWKALAAPTVAAFLGIWMSQLSAVLLMVVVVVEAIWTANRWSMRLRGALQLSIPVLAGVGLERIIQAIHRGYAWSHGVWYQRTDFATDPGHLWENLVGLRGTLAPCAWWPVFPAAALLALVAGFVCWRRPAEISTDSDRLARTGLALTLAALAVLSSTVMFAWSRRNGYAARYLAPAYFCATLGAVASTLALIARTSWISPRRFMVPGSAALAALSVLACKPRPTLPDAAALQRVSAELARRAPDGVLMGAYWGTYRFVDGSAEHPLIPVLREGEFDRMGWTGHALSRAEQIVLSHVDNAVDGSPDAPVPFIHDRDTLLALAHPRWLTDENFSFSLYRNITTHSLPGVQVAIDGVIQHDARRINATPKSTFEVTFPAQSEGRLLLFFGASRSPPEHLPTLVVDADAAVQDVRLEAQSPVLSVSFGHDGGPAVTRMRFRMTGSDAAALRSAWLLPDRTSGIAAIAARDPR